MTGTAAQSHQTREPFNGTETETVHNGRTQRPTAGRTLAVARLVLGLVFLWPFLDKTFGLGIPTTAEASWLAGNSPTSGYLSNGVEGGTFATLFTSMSGQWWVDLVFMFGMGAVGTALILGIGMRAAALGASCLMGSLWLSSLPIEQNPFVDQHLVYACVAIALAVARAGDTWGLGKPWARSALVCSAPFLR